MAAYLRDPEAHHSAELARFDAEANRHGVMVPSLVKETYTEAECPDCRDLGYVRIKGVQEPCHCNGTYLADAFAHSVGGRRGVTQTFEAFDVKRNPRMTPALEATKAFAAMDGPPWLVIAGGRGIGKTHLAIASTRAFAARGKRIIYRLVPTLFDQMRDAMDDPNDSPAAITRQLQEIDLLVLDDYGMEKETPWTQERLDTVLVHRATFELPTVITTNIGGINSDRIESRMSDRSLCRIEECPQAEDMRPSLRAVS